MSKFMEKWDEVNKCFVIPQGTDDLKKLTAVVENLLAVKLPEVIDAEIVVIVEDLKKKVEEIHKAMGL